MKREVEHCRRHLPKPIAKIASLSMHVDISVGVRKALHTYPPLLTKEEVQLKLGYQVRFAKIACLTRHANILITARIVNFFESLLELAKIQRCLSNNTP